MRNIVLALALVSGLAVALPAGAATPLVTPGTEFRDALDFGVSVNASATSEVATRAYQSDAGQDYRQSKTVGFLTAAASASAVDEDAESAAASAESRMTINFADAANATISFRGGSEASATGVDGSAFAGGGQFFTYYFTALADATLDLTYAFSGPVLGCCGNRIELQSFETGFLFGETIYDRNIAGTLAGALTAGQSYRLMVSKNEYFYDAAAVRGVGSMSKSFDDVIRFSITDPNAVPAVPEPTSWLLMMLGFGMIGAAMRRRSTIRYCIAS